MNPKFARHNINDIRENMRLEADTTEMPTQHCIQDLVSRGSIRLMSLPKSDGKLRSGPGEIQARPKITGIMIENYELFYT